MRRYLEYTCPIDERRGKKNKWKPFVGRFVICFFLFCIAVGAFSYSAHSPILKINEVKVSGNQILSETAVLEKVSKLISGKYFWLFPKNNILLYPMFGIKRELRKDFLIIKEISASSDFGGNLEILIEERKPVGLWCDSLKDEKCYFLDKDGYIYDNAPSFSGSAYFEYRGVVEEEPLGKTFLSKEDFTNISLFVEYVKNFGFVPVSVFVNIDGDAFLKTSSGGEVKFGMRDDMKNSLENLQSVIFAPVSTSTIKKINGVFQFQYIDLRYGDKVFVK